MQRIEAVAGREQALPRLMEIWEGAVRATHDFLDERDIVALRPDVAAALRGIEALYGSWDGKELCGFLGVEQGHIEMLFVDAARRGQGLGDGLMRFALEELGANSVDVNEQNTQAVGFYQRCGFVVCGRSAVDGQGRAFPLLHMKQG